MDSKEDWKQKVKDWSRNLKNRKVLAYLDQIERQLFGPKTSILAQGPYSQSYGFSTSHVWMWELYHQESWASKNWCFPTVVLEKTLQSPLLYSKKV